MSDDDDPDYTHLISLLGNYMEANRKLHEQVTELQARSTRETLARRESLRSMVRTFNASHGVKMPSAPTRPTDSVVRLRLKLIAEEFLELLAACTSGGTWDFTRAEYHIGELIDNAIFDVNTVGFADACADLQYVIEGAMLAFGIDSGPVLAEVHRSNLSKVGAPKGENGKVSKGPNYSPPDLYSVLVAQGWKPITEVT